MAARRRLSQQVLRGHQLCPALAVDRRWNLVLANPAAQVFLDGVDPGLLEPPVNMMRLGLHPKGFAPRLRNLPQVRVFLLSRLARQVQQSGDPELAELYAELVGYGAPDELAPPDPAEVMLPIHIHHAGAELCLFNTITTFGAPFDLTLEEIAIEAYYPADARTAQALQRQDPVIAGPPNPRFPDSGVVGLCQVGARDRPRQGNQRGAGRRQIGQAPAQQASKTCSPSSSCHNVRPTPPVSGGAAAPG